MSSGTAFLAFWAVQAPKATVVVCLALAATSALRRSAAARHLVWSCTLAALVLLPPLAAWMPVIELPLLPEPGRGGGESRLAAAGEAPATESTVPGVEIAPQAAQSSSPAAAVATFTLPLYSTGAGLVLAHYLLGLAQVHRLRRGSRGGDPGLRSLLRSLRSLARDTTTDGIDVRVSPAIDIPLAVGLIRPTILLPAAAGGWSLDEKRDVILHELAHLRRRDGWSRAVGRLACALHWFNPLVWLAAHRLVREAEHACDDRVLLAGSEPSAYAECLLRRARALRRPPPVAAAAMARRPELSRRIESILDPTSRRSAMTRVQIASIGVGAALLLLLVIAPLRVVAAPRQLEGVRLDGRERAFAAAKGSPPLHEASAAGDLTRVQSLLRGGADPDRSERSESTPLILAATAGNTEVVQALLAAGADPNQTGSAGKRTAELLRSPLAAAARYGHLEIARLLLAAGAEVDATRRGDATPLIEGARGGHLELARLLLEHGADPGRVVRGDGTPLIAAAASGNPDIVDLLLAAGADPNRAVVGDGSPLIQATRAGCGECAASLIAAGADVDAFVDGDDSPLFHAVQRGDAATVQSLLDSGADANVTWSGDGTPLLVAARHGHDDIVDLLLAAGARADEGVRGDGNALIQAAAIGDVALLERMLRGGADPDASVRGDGSPLIAAARGGHLQAVELLLAHGADVDIMVRGDENPLIQASGAGHLDVVRSLVTAGADVDARAVVGSFVGGREVRTALGMARRGGHREVVDFLLSADAVE